MANYLSNIIYLSNADYETLVSTGTVTIDGTTITYSQDDIYITPDKLASSTENGLMSSSDKVKLDGIASGAQANVIESVKVNGTALTPSNKAIDITSVPSSIVTGLASVATSGSYNDLSNCPILSVSATTTTQLSSLVGVPVLFLYSGEYYLGRVMNPSGTTYSFEFEALTSTNRYIGTVSTNKQLSEVLTTTYRKNFALDSEVVKTDGNQSISGIKTFTSGQIKLKSAYDNFGTIEIYDSGDGGMSVTFDKPLSANHAQFNSFYVENSVFISADAVIRSGDSDYGLILPSDMYDYSSNKVIATTDLLTPKSIGQGLTTTNINGYNGIEFTVGTSDYNGLYIFTYDNCMVMIPVYSPTAGTEYKTAATLVNSAGSYEVKVLTYRYTSSNGKLQIYQKQDFIPTGYGAALFKIKLY